MGTYVLVHDLSNNQKGAVAEAAIEFAALKAGIAVYKPLSGHSRADLIFELGDELWRVQVKWGQLSVEREVVTARLSGARCSPRAGYLSTPYREDEVDLFAIYCGDLDRSFLVPIDLASRRHMIQLRLTPTRNNQRACINLAEEYDFDGAVAQLGERVTGSHEVRGSSPLSSTESPPAISPAVTVGSNALWEDLGHWMDRVAAGEEVIITRRGRPRFRMLPINGESPPATDDSTDMARSRGGEWSRHRAAPERSGVVASRA